MSKDESKPQEEIVEELVLASERTLSPTQIKFLKSYQENKCNPARACIDSNIGYYQYFCWKKESRHFKMALESIKDFWLEAGKARLIELAESTEDPEAALNIMKSLDPSLDPSYNREVLKQKEFRKRTRMLLDGSQPQIKIGAVKDPLADD